MSQLRRCYIHSDVEISESAMKVLQEAKKLSIPDYDLQFAFWEPGKPSGVPILSLGTPAMDIPNRTVIAPSVAQLLTKADVLTRMGYAFKLLVDPPELPPMNYTVLRGWKAAVEGIGSFEMGEEVVVDIETSGDVSVDRPDYERVISVALFNGKGKVLVIAEKALTFYEVRESLERLLAKCRIITVNGKFDLKYFDCEAWHYFDVQLAHYALFPAAGDHGLKPSAKRYLGLDDWDAPNKKYTGKKTYTEPWHDAETEAWADARSYSGGSGYERIPRRMLYEYNAWDVYATWHWKVLMQEALRNDDMARMVFDHLMRLSDMFQDIERPGQPIDIEYMEPLKGILEAEKESLWSELSQIAGKPINPNSPMQVKAWYAERGEALPMRETTDPKTKRKKSAPSSNESALTEVLESETYSDTSKVFAEKLLLCRENNKNLGTYVNGFLDRAHGGTVYATFKLFASITGRLGATEPAVMTIPRDPKFRRIIKASGPGRLLAGPDYSQAELRVMACESMDPWLVAAFQPGAPDFFDNLLGQSYPETDWIELHHEVEHGSPSEQMKGFYKDKRASMKGVVYGASFNRGVKAIAAALKIPVEEAQLLMDGFIRPGSEFDLWRKDIADRSVNGESIVNRFGRHFQAEVVTSRNRQSIINSALAFIPQSTANDIALSAALTIHKWMPDYDSRIILTCHDQILADVPEDIAMDVAKKMQVDMEQAAVDVYGTEVPFAAEASIGKNWAEV